MNGFSYSIDSNDQNDQKNVLLSFDNKNKINFIDHTEDGSDQNLIDCQQNDIKSINELIDFGEKI